MNYPATTHSPASHRLAAVRRPRRLRAVLLGAGTVNGGVLKAIGTLSDRVEVSAIVTRTNRQGHDPRCAWLTEVDAAFDIGPDVVIEALPDCATAEKALKQAADRGIHIISANKAVLARLPALEQRIRRTGARLSYSAAVGGGVPVLETIDRLRRDGEDIVSVRGVLNGTSNYVLDQVQQGKVLEDAVAAAQRAGFAEADPSADLDGLDAACKLSLIARKAFEKTLLPDTISRDRLSALSEKQIKTARALNFTYRQCAELKQGHGRLRASVRIEALPPGDSLIRARKEENVVDIKCASGLTVSLHGKGAGQEPTASSVLQDLKRLLRTEAGQ